MQANQAQDALGEPMNLTDSTRSAIPCLEGMRAIANARMANAGNPQPRSAGRIQVRGSREYTNKPSTTFGRGTTKLEIAMTGKPKQR
jgi:hypothetical protein